MTLFHRSAWLQHLIGGKAKALETRTLSTARAAQPDPGIGDAEKDVLFQQFLEWDKKRRVNQYVNR